MRGLFVLTVAAVIVCAGACTLSTEGGLPVAAGAGGQATGGGTTSSSGTGGTGGTASGTGGSTSTTSGTGGAGGSSSGGPENCLDGVDNDGNNLTDCADPACQPDYECVPDVPTDWTGYAYSATVTVPAPSPSLCPDTTMPDLYLANPSGAPAQCDACSCGAVQGASCGYPVMDCFEGSDACGNGVDGTFNNNGTCQNFGNPWDDGTDDSCIMAQVSQLSGTPTCPASGGTATLPLAWGSQVQICDMPSPHGTGCSTGEVCVPSAETAFPDICITRDGDHSCPSGWLGETAYSGATDGRGCSACGCPTLTGITCSYGTITVWDAGNCLAGGSGAINIGTSCVDISDYADNNSGSYRFQSGSLSGGSCAPSGGQPTGTVTPTGPITVCCR